MIELHDGNKFIPFKEFVFPAGEEHVQLNIESMQCETHVIIARIQNSSDLVQLMMLRDALDRVDCPVVLVLPYVPYSRQDRVCNPGEAFSLKVFTQLINAMSFERVVILDPHSDVTPALIDRVRVIDQASVVWAVDKLSGKALSRYDLVLSPDAGSNKKASAVAKALGKTEFIRADKLRDLQTGKIIESTIYCDSLAEKSVLIVDDICERGGTFIGLAEALKKKGCKDIGLFVTHGIFGGESSAPTTLQTLRSNGIEVFCTNSYSKEYASLENVYDVEKIMDELLRLSRE